MNRWSELEREQVVDYDKLVRKLECADYPRLIDTIESMLQELISNPKVNVLMADKELELLESYRRKSLDDFKKRDHHLTVLVFRKLAQIIIAKHWAELTYVRNGKDKTPVENIEISLRSNIISSQVRSRGIHNVCVFLDSYDELRDVVYETILPSSMGAEWRHQIPVVKIMLDLFALDDYSLDSVEAYSESQHDWALSSTCRILAIRWEANDKIKRVYNRLFVDSVTALLVWGCGEATENETKVRMMGPLGLDSRDDDNDNDDQKWADNLYLIHATASTSTVIRNDSGLYNKEIVEFVLTYELPSGRNRTYSFEDIKKHYMTERDWQWDYKSNYRGYYIRNSNCFPIEHSRGSYHRVFTPMKSISDIHPEIDAGSSNPEKECRTAKLPQTLKSRITKDYLRDLEARTKFIHNFIADGCFMANILKSGVHDGRPVSSDDVHEMLLNYGLMFKHHLPLMIYPLDNEVRPLNYEHLMEYIPLGGSYYDDVDRNRAFIKAYFVHQMIDIPDAISNDDVEVTPLDNIVMTDVIEAYQRISGRLIIESKSEWFRKFADRCISLIEESTVSHPVSRWNSEERANNITPLYSKMLDGEAKDLEKTFEHIDEVMIDSLFDYFIDYELDNSDMPDDFIIEGLQMDTMNGYEDAISSHLAVIVDR